jgi:fructose-1,6-bisphosphatase/inositol monophosphatase family enzyme
MPFDTHSVVERLLELQRKIRDAVLAGRDQQDLSDVSRASTADTIYTLDALIEPIVDEYCEHWGKSLPMVVICEGLEPETGKTFPAGTREEDAVVRIILDPVDGTRGVMYDKRPAWSLAGIAPNKGAATRLSDITVAAMTELPTSKMGLGDVLWAIKGEGAHGRRESLHDASLDPLPLPIRPSQADTIAHGFATVSNFFPGTKVLASVLMEEIASRLLGPADVTKAMVFEDQYISTGGQLYELIVGHDRFNADLRPLFYRCTMNGAEGLCCHPYDCATWLIAEEAGVILTDGLGNRLDGPMDCVTGLNWAGFSNPRLFRKIQPIIKQFFENWGVAEQVTES